MGLGALTTFHGGSTKEVIVRLMSPPISLRIYQISTIQAVAVLAIHNNRRIVRYVDEIIPTQKPGSIKIRRIYDRDKDPYGEKIFVKSYYENKDFMKRSIEIITSKQD
jgi:type IV secretory pathway ATPase VirB11/archaellum biosynthesis ATPase